LSTYPSGTGNRLRQPRVVFAVPIAFMGLVAPVLSVIFTQLPARPGRLKLLVTSCVAVIGITRIRTGWVVGRRSVRRALA